MASSRTTTAVALPTQVPLLSEAQLAHFKREGYLVLPAALDPALCARARDHMWSVIGEEVPRMRRHDPGTWTPFDQDAEPTGATRAEGADHPYFSCGGHRFYLKCGAERLFLDRGGQLRTTTRDRAAIHSLRLSLRREPPNPKVVGEERGTINRLLRPRTGAHRGEKKWGKERPPPHSH